MLKRLLLPLALLIAFFVFAGCGTEATSQPEQVPATEHSDAQVSDEAEEAPQESDDITSDPATDAEPVEGDASGEATDAVGSLQSLNWAADDENCIIPGLVISGEQTGEAPCDPVDLEHSGEDGDEIASTDVVEDIGDANDQAAPAESDASNEPAAVEATTLAVSDLSEQLGVSAEQIEVCEVCAVAWPDSSLGCPQPDMMYAQMIQEGYLIELSVDEESFFYHSGGDQTPFLCEEAQQVLPDGVQQ